MSIKLHTRNDWENFDPALIPSDFITQVTQVITDVFKDKLEGDTFHLFGHVYPKELILVCSLQHGTSVRSTTAYASIDHEVGADKQLEKKLYALVDFFGNFFQDFFENGRSFSYEDIWSEVKDSEYTYHVRINRDNIQLDTKADRFLDKKNKND